MMKRKVQDVLRTLVRLTVSAFVHNLDEGAWL